jgi:hypothetical protein
MPTNGLVPTTAPLPKKPDPQDRERWEEGVLRPSSKQEVNGRVQYIYTFPDGYLLAIDHDRILGESIFAMRLPRRIEDTNAQ